MWILIIFLYSLIYISRSQKDDFAGIKFRKLPKKKCEIAKVSIDKVSFTVFEIWGIIQS